MRSMVVAEVPGVGGTRTGRCGTWDRSMMPGERSERTVRTTRSWQCQPDPSSPSHTAPKPLECHAGRTCCIVEGEGGLPGRQPAQHVRPLRHGRGCGVVVHLLRRDVVVDDGLPVLHGCRVRVAPDEVRGVQVWVRGARSQMPWQVVSSSWERKGCRCEALETSGFWSVRRRITDCAPNQPQAFRA